MEAGAAAEAGGLSLLKAKFSRPTFAPMSRGLVFMLQSVVLYTSANLLVKALAILPTPQLVFLRSAISFLFCALWIWRKGDPLLGHNRKWLVLRGVSGMIALTLFFHTIRHIPLASATVIPLALVIEAIRLGAPQALLCHFAWLDKALPG